MRFVRPFSLHLNCFSEFNHYTRQTDNKFSCVQQRFRGEGRKTAVYLNQNSETWHFINSSAISERARKGGLVEKNLAQTRKSHCQIQGQFSFARFGNLYQIHFSRCELRTSAQAETAGRKVLSSDFTQTENNQQSSNSDKDFTNINISSCWGSLPPLVKESLNFGKKCR